MTLACLTVLDPSKELGGTGVQTESSWESLGPAPSEQGLLIELWFPSGVE